MLGRDTDDKGRQAFLTQVGRKQYSDVIDSIVNSAEYKTILNKKRRWRGKKQASRLQASASGLRASGSRQPRT